MVASVELMTGDATPPATPETVALAACPLIASLMAVTNWVHADTTTGAASGVPLLELPPLEPEPEPPPLEPEPEPPPLEPEPEP